jgi:phospho-N-acetylmuramoyl-pentapeptide-transferase
MLYWLFVESPLKDLVPGATVFRFISFRTAWALITALVIAYVVFPWFIEWMRQQRVNQIIRSDGPESHLLNKVGTPTMGGVCILMGVTASTLLWARLDSLAVWVSLLVMLGYGLIGFVDDWKKVMERSADGLAGRWKIVGQIVFGGGGLAIAWQGGILPVTLTLPFIKDVTLDFAAFWAGAPNLSVLFLLFGLFILVAESNAVNLTDGLDGLAIGPTMTSSATYALLAYLSSNAVFAKYLGIPHVASASELTVLCMAMVGAGLGFLWYNAYPAQVFMGDVGSLAIGGMLGIVAILSKHELLLVVVGGIFVLEAASVVLQVGSFKLRGKRIFQMAPIHHHYEKLGWSEPKIIVRFWIISVILALVALSTLKLR